MFLSSHIILTSLFFSFHHHATYCLAAHNFEWSACKPWFLYQILTCSLGEALQRPRKFSSPGQLPALTPPPTPQPSRPHLTVAWENNCTWKTVKTILAEISSRWTPQLTGILSWPQVWRNMTRRKNLEVLAIYWRWKSECLISWFPSGWRFTRLSCFCQLVERSPELHSGGGVMNLYRRCS